MIPAGRLRHRITLQSKETTRDVMGGEIITWVDVATVWAEVAALSGRALIAAQQAQSEITTRITLRYRADIKPDWRILHNGTTYTINALIPDTQNTELVIQATSGLKN
jgi:SPP1 family predicted phage head-tail adaptor